MAWHKGCGGVLKYVEGDIHYHEADFETDVDGFIEPDDASWEDRREDEGKVVERFVYCQSCQERWAEAVDDGPFAVPEGIVESESTECVVILKQESK